MAVVSPQPPPPSRLTSPHLLSRTTSSTTLGGLTTLTTASTAVAEPTRTSARKIDAAATDSDDDSDDGFAELRQRRAQMATVARQVRILYDAGVPLFTRDALVSLAHQLDQAPAVRTGAQNAVFVVIGMDGRRVRLATESGAVSATPAHPDIVLVNVKPQIDYWTIEKLTGSALWHIRRFDPMHAFLSTRISHVQEARYRDANGVVSVSGATTIAELASDLASTALATATATNTYKTPPTAHDAPAPRHRLPVDEAQAAFRHHRAVWEASDACHELRETLWACLAPQLMPRGRAVIRKIIAFACSSMTEEREGGSARHAVQHAMVLTVRDVLEQIQEARLADDTSGGSGDAVDSNHPVQIQCFAQDPAYDAADAAVLATAGIAVVDDPHGFLAVDDKSFVIAVAPSVPVRQIVADLARPAAMIWGRVAAASSLASSLAPSLSPPSSPSSSPSSPSLSPTPSSRLIDDMGGWSDPASARVRHMLESGYAEFDFPRDPHNFGTVDGIAIYVRTSTSVQPPEPPSSLPLLQSLDGQGWGLGLLHRLQRTLLCQPEE